MRVKVLSDLHLEFCPFHIPYNGEELLILAGDISPKSDAALCLITSYLETNAESKVILVLGNHDYYGSQIAHVDAWWRSIDIPRFYFLQNSSVVLDGLRFWGATMWTDLNGGDPRAVDTCVRGINDFYEIIGMSDRQFCEVHAASRDSLALALESSPEPVVVITHHLPSARSLTPTIPRSLLDAAYTSTDLEALIAHPKTHMWVHGHTHFSFDYVEPTGARVVCNPRGYVRHWKGHIKKRENKRFAEELVLTVSPTPTDDKLHMAD